MSRSDPIRARYYEAVERADKVSDGLFYSSAILSFASLLVEKHAHPAIYDWVMILFALAVIALFVVGLTCRLYFVPRAEDKRRQDFFTNACGVGLTHEKTDGYYNNDLLEPIKRIAAQVLENSHFSKAIALRMAHAERIKVLIYAILWVVCLFYRQSDLGIVIAASQAVFSEQIMSKWLRLEWLRTRFEKTYDDVYRLFQSKPAEPKFRAMALESLGMYETAKANGAIILSSGVFRRLNAGLSAEWDRIKAELRI